MTAVTVEYTVSFAKKREQPRMKRSAKAESPKERFPSSKAGPSATRTARLLALAHYIERSVESGLLKDYAASARLLGMTRARMAQVMNLLLLSPGIQEAILAGKMVISERALRAVLTHVSWEEQPAALSTGN